MVAIAGSLRNAPSRASARDRHTVMSGSANAGPQLHEGPAVPATSDAPKLHASAARVAATVSRARESQAKTSDATVAATNGPSASRASNAGHFACAPPAIQATAEGVPAPH